MGHHPVVKIFDIGDGVDDAARPQHIGVLGEQCWGYNAGLVLARFEMRVWKEEEQSGQGVF